MPLVQRHYQEFHCNKCDGILRAILPKQSGPNRALGLTICVFCPGGILTMVGPYLALESPDMDTPVTDIRDILTAGANAIIDIRNKYLAD